MSAYLPGPARETADAAGHWLPGAIALVVLGTLLLALLAREMFRGALTSDSERRVRATRAVMVPLLLCAGIAIGARFLELGT